MTAATATVWRDGEALFTRASVARNPLSRMLGLLPRVGLDPEEALIFPRCRSLHTFLMRFSIDIAFLSESGEIVRLFPEVPRGRLLAGGPDSHDAIESAAQAMRRRGISVGQRLWWTES